MTTNSTVTETSDPKFFENPLNQAQRSLQRIRKTARICMLIPIPILISCTGALFYFGSHWLQDPFLALFLGLIYVIFFYGQFMAIKQMRRILPGIDNAEKAVKVLIAAGDAFDLPSVRLELLKNTPPGHLRDLLIRWIDLGLQGETLGSEALLDNAWERRSISDNRLISLHVSLNRTTLKLGFLGTLIGIIMTFPPMKRAIMGLSGSDGELKFISDIAMAIDGDEYAIMNTLLATALSILIEFATIQLLERVLLGFDLVNSHMNDWNLTRLQPMVRKLYGPEAQLQTLEARRTKLEQGLMHAQKAIEGHLGHLTEALRTSASQMEQITKVQALVGKRVAELAEYEQQYRAFLATKQKSATPNRGAGEA